MDSVAGERQERKVQVHTTRGGVEGRLQTGKWIRTLDDLNVVTRHFVTLHEPRPASGEWALENGPLAVAKSAIQFVLEVDELERPSSMQPDPQRFARAPVRLWVGEFSIRGFVHVPSGGTAKVRLDQHSHAFIALTSASVIGQETEIAVPFLAVNRESILAAEELVHEDQEESEQERETGEEPTFEVVEEGV
jgi:hypothetical protein